MQDKKRTWANIMLYTDGACSGNPGPGGWSALLLIRTNLGKEPITIRGGEKHTTNNRMEISAVIEGLSFINKNIDAEDITITVYSDSAYVVDNVNNGHAANWKKNNWLKSDGSMAKNHDLWGMLLGYLENMNIKIEKVKGHSTDKFNNHVDKIAVSERDRWNNILNNC